MEGLGDVQTSSCPRHQPARRAEDAAAHRPTGIRLTESDLRAAALSVVLQQACDPSSWTPAQRSPHRDGVRLITGFGGDDRSN